MQKSSLPSGCPSGPSLTLIFASILLLGVFFPHSPVGCLGGKSGLPTSARSLASIRGSGTNSFGSNGKTSTALPAGFFLGLAASAALTFLHSLQQYTSMFLFFSHSPDAAHPGHWSA